ncbi:uncharacterized protein SCODWIG_03327 [Saccharomycodes ludwigii]|uniref:RNase MRP protein 1 RNA binding domain-containing protein n=1 Tax=Saccharomycodes ludwigii TaxID=36035 RepID=A0A376BA71_9ASCO|nr:hypothetical protein SCDLUD_001796 [Saccharomycodes ludwigii]KAH3902008.1 hypothetical protein SCDLUD_001796 [Saccharomycodes ludwigii]SSD61566.1 uncharacterized protein SCODWIG_03327 [Saccharomycodes ludwigii]
MAEIPSNVVSQELTSTLQECLTQLEQEYRIIVLINHRNKNQHKVATWWMSFNILKRKTCKTIHLLRLYFDAKQLNQKIIQSTKQTKKTKVIKERLKKLRNINLYLISLYDILCYFQKKQLKSIYYNFNGIIALGQFATLGVVLVGILARIYSLSLKLTNAITESVEEIKTRLKRNTKYELDNNIDKDSEVDDIGEEIVLEQAQTSTATLRDEKSRKRQITLDGDEFVEKKKKPVKKVKKSKNKKKGNAIDDIFG